MLLQRHHDLGRDLDRRLDDPDLLARHQLVLLVNDMDLEMMVLQLYVVGNFLFQLLQDVVHLVAPQNLGEQNLGAHLSYQDVVHLVAQLQRLAVSVVDVEVRRLLKMDCCQVLVDLDEVDEEQRYL
jgi:hypothetical protein